MSIKTLQPNQLFVIDGLGALVSAFMLGVVLINFQHLVGIPTPTLYLLGAIPCGFLLYDIYSRFSNKEDKSGLLFGIGILNLLYCLLSVGLAVSHADVITQLGWIYLIIEVIIVSGIGWYEIKVSRTLSDKLPRD